MKDDAVDSLTHREEYLSLHNYLLFQLRPDSAPLEGLDIKLVVGI